MERSTGNGISLQVRPGSLELVLTGYHGVSVSDDVEQISLKRQIDGALNLLIDEELLESVSARR